MLWNIWRLELKIFLGPTRPDGAVTLVCVCATSLLQYWVLFNFVPSLISKDHCHGMFFVVNFIGNNAVWIIVAMTTERFIVVMVPLKGLETDVSLVVRDLREMGPILLRFALYSWEF